MGNSEYIYAVASIRAREKGLLTDADIQTLSGMKDSEAVMTYLTEHGWGEGVESKNPEEILAAETEKTNAILMNLKVNPEIVDVLSYQDRFQNLKTAVKEVCTGTEDWDAFYEDEKLPANVLVQAVRDGDFEKLPDYMREVAKFAKETLLSTRDGQRCDVIIDRACLDRIEAAANSSDAFLADYAETLVAVADIKIAVRACRTKSKLPLIQEALAPCKSFDVKELSLAAANSLDAVYDYLTRKGFAEAVEAIKESFSSFERWCDNEMIKKILPQKHKIDSSGPIVAYYLARKNEIQMVRIIVTAKDNQFPDEAISERLRRMYG